MLFVFFRYPVVICIAICSEKDNFETSSNSSSGSDDISREAPTVHAKHTQKSMEMDEVLIY
jgi:hypothetical protein